MTTIQIPDLIGAVDRFRTAIYHNYEETLRAGQEWFARCGASVYVFLLNLYRSILVMSPIKLKTVHVSAKAGLLGAIVYPFSDKRSLRLAIDMFILVIAWWGCSEARWECCRQVYEYGRFCSYWHRELSTRTRFASCYSLSWVCFSP